MRSGALSDDAGRASSGARSAPGTTGSASLKYGASTAVSRARHLTDLASGADAALSRTLEPGFPRWIGLWVTFGRCFRKEFRDLHSRTRVRFAFTRYTHLNRALPVFVSC